MASTTQTTPVRRDTPPRDGRIAPARPRRRTGMMAGGIMLAALGGLLVAWMIGSASDRTDVLVMARDVPYGQAIAPEDLTVTAVAVDTLVDTVPADQLDALVGQVAAVHLLTGSLLAPGQVTPDTPPGPGEVLVPLPVAADRLPAGGLYAGDRLLVVDAPSAGSDPPITEPKTFGVTVVRIGEPDLNGVRTLDVAAHASDGPGLATRAASGRFALVLLDNGGGP